MTSVPHVSLSAGSTTIDIPQLGFGVWQVPDADVTDAVTTALEVGYRSIDTAAAYENEDGVGRALARTDVPREEIFLTTKVWNDQQGYDATLRSFDASAKRLGQEIVDLYLIHWPVPAKDAYVDTWRALLELRSQGRIRAAGVCNFQPAHLQRLLDETGELPALNQIELHPRLQQARAARLPRPARHRHRGLEPAGLRRRAASGPRDHRDRAAALAHPRPGGPALARAARPRRHPQVGDALAHRRELRRSSTSSSSRATSPRSRAWTAASAPAPTPTPSTSAPDPPRQTWGFCGATPQTWGSARRRPADLGVLRGAPAVVRCPGRRPAATSGCERMRP